MFQNNVAIIIGSVKRVSNRCSEKGCKQVSETFCFQTGRKIMWFKQHEFRTSCSTVGCTTVPEVLLLQSCVLRYIQK